MKEEGAIYRFSIVQAQQRNGKAYKEIIIIILDGEEVLEEIELRKKDDFAFSRIISMFIRD